MVALLALIEHRIVKTISPAEKNSNLKVSY